MKIIENPIQKIESVTIESGKSKIVLTKNNHIIENIESEYSHCWVKNKTILTLRLYDFGNACFKVDGECAVKLLESLSKL